MDTDDEDVDVDAYLDSLEAEEAAQPRSARSGGQTSQPKEAPRACFHIVKSVLETQCAMGATGASTSRASFRSCFVIAGPCLLVIVVISIFLCQNLAQVDRGHIAKHALQLQELIFAPSTDGTAPPSAANDGLTDDVTVLEVVEETNSSTLEPLKVEEREERGNRSDPGTVKWFDSSYFATVPREKSLKCPLEATVSQWNGRLGNHIHQILNMVLFAHLCSTAEVHFPKHQDNKHAYSHQIGLLDMPTSLNFPPREQILNHPLKCPRHGRHTHPWFGNYCQTNTPMWVYHQLALDFVRPYLGEYIRECLTTPEDDDAEQTLTVHMRADDVAKYPEYSWGQPPCSMYEKIIKENKFSRILFVKKGDAPCAQRLLAAAEEAGISVTYPPAFDETNFKPWHMRIFYREDRVAGRGTPGHNSWKNHEQNAEK
eukprot:s631_g30.t1